MDGLKNSQFISLHTTHGQVRKTFSVDGGDLEDGRNLRELCDG